MISMPSSGRAVGSSASVFVAAICGFGIVLGAGSGIGEARAQGFDSEVRIDQLQPSSATSMFVRAEGPRAPFGKGIAYALRVTGDYGFEPLRSVVVDGTVAGGELELAPVKHAALVHVGGSITPVHWLDLELDMPFAVFEAGNDDARVSGQALSAGTMGIGDLRVGALTRPINTAGFDLTMGGRFWAPTGTPAAYMTGGDRFFRVEAVVAAAGETGFLSWGCTLGVAPLFFLGRDGDRVAASCAAVAKLAPVFSLGLEPHAALFAYAPRNTTSQTTGLGDASFALALEPMLSMALHVGALRVTLAGGVGLGGAPGTPTARGLFSIGYAALGEHTPEDPSLTIDSDVDGTPDIYDACPRAAGLREKRGCPDERDADGDGFTEDDACPEQAGTAAADARANGCPDRDNDHFADPIDRCPTEPGESEGCPEFVRLRDKEFVSTPPIAFAGAASTVDPIMRAAFGEIVNIVRANPKISQISVKLGTKRAFNAVTDARAKALLKLLGEQNLDAARFEIVLDDKLANGRISVVVAR
ncbi:MAG: hypothetical protein EXR75_02975 [Myxococcales bacterium]|nr:hypothetical protein [Myxococcales bacterium]